MVFSIYAPARVRVFPLEDRMNEIVNEHLKSLLGERNVDRRAFVVTSLGAGFAMAVMPVTAQTITTSAEGLTAGEVKVPTKDGDDARVSRDARDGRQFPGHPGRAGSLRRARAHQGHLPAHREERLFRNRPRVVRAPGRSVQVHGYVEARVGARRQGARRAGHGRSRRMRRLREDYRQGRDGTARYHRILLGRPDRAHVRRAQSQRQGRRRRGTAHTARAFAPGDKTPLDVAPQIKAAVLGLYGGADGGIPNDTVEKMFAALKAAGNARSEVTIYPDTPHAFNADYRPSYRKEQATMRGTGCWRGSS